MKLANKILTLLQNRSASNSLWLLSDRIIRTAVGLLVSIYIARHLGPAQYGILASALVVAVITQSIAQMGLDSVILRELSHPTDNKPESIVGTAILMRMAAGATAALGGAVYLQLVGTHELFLTYSLCVAMAFQPVAEVFEMHFHSNLQSRKPLILKSISYLFGSGARIYLTSTGAGTIAIAATYSFETIFASILLWRIFYQDKQSKTTIKPHLQATKSAAQTLFFQGWPLLFSSMAIVAYTRFDLLLVQQMVGEAEAGKYAAILPFSQGWSFVPTIIATSTTPILSKIYSSDREKYIEKVKFVYSLVIYISIVIITGTCLIAPFLTNVVLGAKYGGSAHILQIHVCSLLFISLGTIQTQTLVIERRTKIVILRTTLAAALGITLNFFLIPKFGAYGSAIAAVTTQFISAVAINILIDRGTLLLQIQGFSNFSNPFKQKRRECEDN